jgi:molybdenum cofactor sulfurtransferase
MKISSGNNMLSLSNEAQYLLVNYSSLHYLHDVLADKLGSENTPSLTDLCLRFRPNFVVECAKNGGRPFAEDNWDHIAINNAAFQVCGGCTRCHMICVDQLTGAKTNEPLRTLLAMRGSKVCQSVFCFGLL